MDAKKKVKFLCEFIPLISFFAVFRLFDIIIATATIVILTLVSTLINYIVNKEFSVVNLISVAMITIFGSITVFSNNPIFIKLKPTIINLCFAAILLFGVIKKKVYLKFLFNKTVVLPDEIWLVLSKRFILFFVLLACLNEIVWRNFSDSIWVSFKAFGLITLSLIFMLLQIPLFKKHAVNTSSLSK